MKPPQIRTVAFFLAAGMLWVLGVLCFVQARPLLDFEDDFSPRDFKEFHGSVVGSIFGQFRMSVGDLLWLKSDEYLHGGVRHRRRTDRERADELHHDLEEHRHGHHQEDEGHASEHDDEDQYFQQLHHDRGDSVTVIPSAETDVRGFFGELDRQVHPFSLHPEHSNPAELAPWYRVLTYVNPNHVRAYVVGAYIIGEHGDQKEAALEFLLEGERNNPLSIEIKEALGRFHFLTLGDPDPAISYFEQAIAIGQQKDDLNSYEEFALRNAYRNRVLLYWRANDDPTTARKMLAQGLNRFPDDKALKRLAQSLAPLPIVTDPGCVE